MTTWEETMGADWYEGYDDKVNTSNFVAISTMPAGPAKDKAIALAQEEIIGLLEQKGVTRDQILNSNTDVGKEFDKYMDRVENSSGSNVDTRNILQDVAYSKTSATDRGNKWGSDDDDSMGRTYLAKIASEGGATVLDLYDKGFGRSESQMAADITGPQYWQAKLDSGEMTIQQIATEFGRSEEAKIKSTFSDEYGRDIEDEGLNYWLEHTGVQSGENAYTSDWNKADATADSNKLNISDAAHKFDASDLLAKSIAARGDYEQYESSIRDHGWLTMGQASSRGQHGNYTAEEVAAGAVNLKPPDAPFTDMETEQVLDWIKQIRSGAMTLDQVKDTITDRGDRMSAFNQGDTDDYTTKDINGDGEITADEIQTGNPTGMGRFASLAEIQATIDSGETPDEIRERLGMEKWGLLTHENEKKLEDFKIKSADFDNYRSTWEGGLHTGGTGGTGGLGQLGWTPEVPDKPGIPDKFPVDRTSIDYMPGVKPDQFSSTPYEAAKEEFDVNPPRERKDIPIPTLAAQGVGKRFTGTSAKGVKMKRSQQSLSIKPKGTTQFNREQQTKSLNI